MNVTMFGAGYVGLVTSACLAEMGNIVVCVDVDQKRIDMLNQGEIPIYEKGLDTLIKRNLENGQLSFTLDSSMAIDHGDLLFIAVGTPSDEDGSADLSYVLKVAEQIGDHLTTPKVVVNKSTVPVGTATKVSATIGERLKSRGIFVDYFVASNPEFLKEGAAVSDFMKPDRIVIGADDDFAAQQLGALYQPFNRNHDKVIHMGVRSAEMTKYASNVMLAAKISLMNEFATLAELLDADIEAVRAGIGSDPRVGHHFIYPGAGYGGSCFPKDVRALAQLAASKGYAPNIIPAIERTNETQKRTVFKQISKHFGDLEGRTIALWGLAFKPETDDMREAPSVTLIQQLEEAGARVQCYDPIAGDEAMHLFEGVDAVEVMDERNATLKDASALVVITEWNEFRTLNFPELQQQMLEPVIFDGRNLYDPAEVSRQGFDYYGIGRSMERRKERRAVAAQPSQTKRAANG